MNDRLSRLRAGGRTASTAGRGRPIATTRVAGYESVSIRLHSVDCVRTTRELDADEMAIIGLATSMLPKGSTRRSVTKSAATIALGKFRAGDGRHFKTPKTLATFSYGGGEAGWPRNYPVTLLMVEKDEGNLGKIAAQFADAVDEKVATALKSAATAATGALLTAAGAGAAAGSVVPLVGTAVGAAVGAGVMAASAAIQKSRADDVLRPEHDCLKLDGAPSKPGEIDGSRRVHTVKGCKGIYRIVTSWAVR